MTIASIHVGFLPVPFDGTEEEGQKNKQSHSWVVAPNPTRNVKIPSWINIDLGREIPQTVMRCSACGKFEYQDETKYPCGTIVYYKDLGIYSKTDPRYGKLNRLRNKSGDNLRDSH